MPNTVTEGYRVVLFLKSPSFSVADLADWPRAVKSSSGYLLRLAGKKYFVHPSSRPDYLSLETDDTRNQPSSIIDIRSHARAKKKPLERATLDTKRALTLMQSLEDDGLIPQGKLHTFLGDAAPYRRNKIRTKIVFNNTNVAEVKTLCAQQENWTVRGMFVSLVEGRKRHYGLAFFDRSPTARVGKIGPVNDALHAILAERLVKLLP